RRQPPSPYISIGDGTSFENYWRGSMSSPTTRFADLERIEAPDLWHEVLEREPGRGGTGRPARVVRVLVVVAIVLLAVPLGLSASGRSVTVAGFRIGGPHALRVLV